VPIDLAIEKASASMHPSEAQICIQQPSMYPFLTGLTGIK